MKCRKCMLLAFTLIELLAVIAVIAILAAVLFPVFATAREKARQSSCAANLKQLGTAVLQYTQDFDEVPPCGNGTGGNGWAGQITSYVKSTGVFICPDDSSPATSTHDSGFLNISYSYNSNISNWHGLNPPRPAQLSKFTSTPTTVMIFESRGCVAQKQNRVASSRTIDPTDAASAAGNGMTTAKMNGGSWASYATGSMGGRIFTSSSVACANTEWPVCAPAHDPGSNFLACDGHVKFLSGDKVSTLDTALSPSDPQKAGISAGTQNLTDGAGATFTLTFSNI